MTAAMGRTTAIVLVAVAVLLIPGTQRAAAQTMTDSFNQEVPKDLDEQVSMARELRLEDYGSGYDLDRSIDMLKAVVSRRPDYYRAWFNLGLALARQSPEDPVAFREAFETAIRIQQANDGIDDGSIFNSYGWALLNARWYDEAESAFKRGLQKKDINSTWTNSALLYNLGRLKFEQLDYETARSYLTLARAEYNNPAAVELLDILEKTRK